MRRGIQRISTLPRTARMTTIPFNRLTGDMVVVVRVARDSVERFRVPLEKVPLTVPSVRFPAPPCRCYDHT